MKSAKSRGSASEFIEGEGKGGRSLIVYLRSLEGDRARDQGQSEPIVLFSVRKGEGSYSFGIVLLRGGKGSASRLIQGGKTRVALIMRGKTVWALLLQRGKEKKATFLFRGGPDVGPSQRERKKSPSASAEEP